MPGHFNSLAAATPAYTVLLQPAKPKLSLSFEIPSLYGIRAIAAFAVVIGHFHEQLVSLGMQAVICFFVLSGYLITSLLLREHSRTGTVALGSFYWRRSLRIFPAAFAFLIVYAILCLAVGREIPWWALVTSALYISNYYMGFGGNGSGVTHTWSLSVEEQFYLIWPTVFRKFRQKLCPILVATVCATILCRLLASYVFDASWDYSYRAFDQRMDALAIGCLLAIADHQARLPKWITTLPGLSLLSMAMVVTMAFVHLQLPIAYTLSALAFAVVIIRAVRQAPFWLNNKVMRYLGAISYSLYLYHQLADNIVPKGLGVARIPAQLGVALVMACLSYHFIEKPFLRFKGASVPGSPRGLPRPSYNVRADVI